ncbi:unnamed protein product [Prorocentrum cordatum]|uniref:GDT1 family protein n=1 Tax=Prorocentrum cordatum TaxID=2364126 RepID=A0ABN9WFA1_9DINO|nr:unnamed protein product [Polarella glacialis]
MPKRKRAPDVRVGHGRGGRPDAGAHAAMLRAAAAVAPRARAARAQRARPPAPPALDGRARERQARAERVAEAARAAEAERKAKAERVAEAARAAEAERKAKAERVAEAALAAEAKRKASAKRVAEAACYVRETSVAEADQLVDQLADQCPRSGRTREAWGPPALGGLVELLVLHVEEEFNEVENTLKDSATKGQKSLIRRWFSKACSPVFLEAGMLTFIAEWGDRSQIATFTLAAHQNPLGVILGGCLGHTFCTSLAVFGGEWLGKRISQKYVATGGGCLFLLFAVLNALGLGGA